MGAVDTTKPLEPREFTVPNVYELVMPDPASGNLTRRKLFLNSSNYQIGGLPGPDYDRVRDRAMDLWYSVGESELVSGAFIWDLAASEFDDNTIRGLAQMHKSFLQDRTVLGHLRSAAAEPLDTLMNAFEFASEMTVDKVAQAVTGDATARAADYAYLLLQNRDKDLTFARASEPDLTMREFTNRVRAESGDVVSVANDLFAGIVTDPTIYAGAVYQASRAGRVIRGSAEAKGVRHGRWAAALGNFTVPEEIAGILKMAPRKPIPLKQAYKTGVVGDYVAAKLGREGRLRKMVRQTLFARNPGEIASRVRLTDVNQVRLFEAARRMVLDDIGEELGRTVSTMDEAKNVARTAGKDVEEFVARHTDNMADALASGMNPERSVRLGNYMDRIADDIAAWTALDSEVAERIAAQEALPFGSPGIPKAIQQLSTDELREFARTPGGASLLKDSGLLGPDGLPLPDIEAFVGREALQTKGAALRAVKESVETSAGTVGNFVEIPRPRMASGMRAWVDNIEGRATRAMGESVETPPSLMHRLGATTVRKMERFIQMEPHARIRVDDPDWHEQVRRLGQEFEGVVPGWTRQMTDEMVDGALQAPSPMALDEFISARMVEGWRRLGYTDEELEALTRQVGERIGKRVYGVTEDGKPIHSPVFSSQQFNEVVLGDMRLFRKAAKARKAGKPLKENALVELADSWYGVWRNVAAARPAYLMRVTMLSEVPRNMLAGHTAPFTDLLSWLTLSFPGKGGMSKELAGFLDEIGVAAVKNWHEIVDLLPEGWDSDAYFRAMLSGVKTPPGLGTREAFQLVRPTEVRNAAVGVDSKGVSRWAQMKLPQQQELYRQAWLSHLNTIVANDPLVRQVFAAGGKVREAVEWLSREGLDYAKGAGLNPGAEGFAARAQAFAKRSLSNFDQLTVNDDTIKAGLGNLKPRHLADIDPPKALPYDIFNTAKSPGHVRLAEIVNDTILGKIWDGAAWFSRQVARQGPYRAEFGSEVARLVGLDRKGGGSADWRKIVLAARGDAKGVKLTATEQRILKTARSHAERRVKQVVYDLAEQARGADLARFIFPFANAWQEEITRWMKFSFERPGTASAMASFARNLQESPAFTQTDPVTGRKYFMVPFSEYLTAFATGEGWNPVTRGREGLKWPMRIGWDNTFMLTNGGDLGPGVGPVFQIPAELMARAQPEWREALKFINPYYSDSLFSKVIPSSIIRGIVTAGTKEGEVAYAQKAKAVLAYGEYTDAEWDDATVRKITRALFIMDGLSQIFIGGGFKPDLPPEIKGVWDFYAQAKREVPEAADRIILEAGFGETLAQWVTEATTSQTGIPPTMDARDFLLNDTTRPLVEKYGDIIWPVLATEAPESEYDPVIFAKQIAEDQRDVRNVPELRDAARLKRSWALYHDVRNKVERIAGVRGVTYDDSSMEGLRKIVSAYQEKLAKADPLFRIDFAGWSESQEQTRMNLEKLNELRTEDFFADTEAKTFLDGYFTGRKLVRGLMAAKEHVTFDSVQNRPIVRLWQQIRDKLIADHPKMIPLYERLMWNDKMDTDL